MFSINAAKVVNLFCSKKIYFVFVTIRYLTTFAKDYSLTQKKV